MGAKCDTAAIERNVAFGAQAPRQRHAGRGLRGRHARARRDPAGKPGEEPGQRREEGLNAAPGAARWADRGLDNARDDRLPDRSGRPARAPVSRHAEGAAPAALQRLSLPVWIPGSYMVREFSRHLSRLRARQGAARMPHRAARQVQLAVRVPGQPDAGAQLRGLRLRHLGAQRPSSTPARLLQRHQPVPARATAASTEPHRLRIGTLPRGWQVATAMPATGAAMSTSAPTTTNWSTTRWSWAASGAASFACAACRTSSSSPAPGRASTASGCWPTRGASARRRSAFWHGRGKPPLCALRLPAERGGRRLRRPGAPRQHRADRARAGSCRARGVAEAERRLCHAARADHARVLPHLERQAPEAARVRAHRLRPRELHPAAVVLRRLHLVLRRPAAAARRADRRAALPAPAGQDAVGVLATPGRRVQSVAEASFDAWVKYYRSDENTPNATVSYYAKGSLVALALDLSLRARRRHAGRGDAPVVGAHPAAARSTRPTSPRLAAGGRPLDGRGTGRLGARHRRPAAAAAAGARRHRLAGRRRRPGRRARPARQRRRAQRRPREERASRQRRRTRRYRAGDELLAVDGWRLRRLDDARGWTRPARPSS